MRPWRDLPEEARGRACREVRSQLQELEAFGFLPVLPDRGPPRATRFQRFGEVRAEPLAASTTWQSPTGDTFAASAGDWLVVDEFGHKRTVRHEEFHASHAPLGGDRWRRTGTVLAWRADEATVIHTMEGKAIAAAGDWIVQGAAGERWPVKPGQFALGYAPVQPEAPAG